MADTRVLLWDVGGVLGSNAWDHAERRRVIEHFGIELEDFELRHEAVIDAFETDRITLDEYLDETVFYQSRSFSREEFRTMMFAQSQPRPESLALARELAASSKYRMATINNESRDLNLYRIECFGLRDIFPVFFSSCFVHLRKPDPAIYRAVLDVLQAPAAECCFIDDREPNLESARQLGISAIKFSSAAQLREQLGTAVVASLS